MNDATVVAKNEADWLATRMVNSFKVLYAALDGAWVEDRLGGHLFVYPAVPIPAFNAIIAVEQRPDDAVSGLACAMAEVEKPRSRSLDICDSSRPACPAPAT